MSYEAVIGLEIHAQLQTRTKMFCQDSTEFGAGENEQVCEVCVGLPGSLPVVNKKAIEFSIKTGLALNCSIRERSVFARKNYFYPDLAKGYQISQFDEPLCENGYVEFFVDGKPHKIRIERAHMEEDAGKSIHHGDSTGVNFNRAGVPLLEIVSGPDLRSPAEAAEYARTVRQILRYLDVCDGNLEEGSLRCDCNVSVRRVGAEKFGTKVEIKNINSFRFIEKALEFEIQRQIAAVESGEKIQQETRLYDPDKNRTFVMRSKEEAHDYRYFPDPDLPAVVLPPGLVEKMRGELPELPLARLKRFVESYKIPEYDAQILTAEKDMAEYYEAVVQVCGNPKSASNWMMTDLLRELNDAKLSIEKSPISASRLGALIGLIDKGTISGKIAKTVFGEMWKAPHKTPEEIVAAQGLVQVSDSGAIEKWVAEVMEKNPQQLADYRGGKEKLYGYFVGQVMKLAKGQANPEMLNEVLKRKLKGD